MVTRGILSCDLPEIASRAETVLSIPETQEKMRGKQQNQSIKLSRPQCQTPGSYRRIELLVLMCIQPWPALFFILVHLLC